MPNDDFYDIVDGAHPDRNFGDASREQQNYAADWAPYLHTQPHTTLAAQALQCLTHTITTETTERTVTALEAETIASLLPTAHEWLQQGFIRATPQPLRPFTKQQYEPMPLFGGWQQRILDQTTPVGVLTAVATTAKTIIDDQIITTINNPHELCEELDALAWHLLQSS